MVVRQVKETKEHVFIYVQTGQISSFFPFNSLNFLYASMSFMLSAT